MLLFFLPIQYPHISVVQIRTILWDKKNYSIVKKIEPPVLFQNYFKYILKVKLNTTAIWEASQKHYYKDTAWSSYFVEELKNHSNYLAKRKSYWIIVPKRKDSKFGSFTFAKDPAEIWFVTISRHCRLEWKKEKCTKWKTTSGRNKRKKEKKRADSKFMQS